MFKKEGEMSEIKSLTLVKQTFKKHSFLLTPVSTTTKLSPTILRRTKLKLLKRQISQSHPVPNICDNNKRHHLCGAGVALRINCNREIPITERFLRDLVLTTRRRCVMERRIPAQHGVFTSCRIVVNVFCHWK